MRKALSSGFHIASAQEIREGKTTDIYFVRTQEILRAKGLSGRRGYAEFTTGGLPERWPWGIFCGLSEVLELLRDVPVNLWALAEGTLFPAQDERGIRVPVMALEGAYGGYCLYETPILGMICQATGVATKAARIRRQAGSALVLAFGVRRMHPAIAPMLDRASFIGGLDGVSSLIGAQTIGRTPMGTMPHALAIAFGEPKAAWRAFDQVMPASVPRIMLIDTYSDEKAEALQAAQTLGKRLAGVRLDTPSSRRGNFAELIREVRWELDLRGFKKVRIVISGGIDEDEIPGLLKSGADGFGIGTAISNAKTVDFAMDLVEWEGKPCAKRGKLGGRKSPWGCARCLKILVAASGTPRPACPGCRAKMKPMFKQFLKMGKRVGTVPPAGAIRRSVLDQLNRIKSRGENA